jgi:hypothetical protein
MKPDSALKLQEEDEFQPIEAAKMSPALAIC